MKKIFFTLMAVLGLILQARAQEMANWKHDNYEPETITIMEALKLSDNTPIIVMGTITENMGNNLFKIKDSSGETIIEIDNDKWNGAVANVGDNVEIRGEIDVDDDEVAEIDVKTVTIK